MVKFAIGSELTAFQPTGVVGSKVLDHAAFLSALEKAVVELDWSKCETRGQGFVVLPESLHSAVSCGEAKIAGLTKADLHPVLYREEWELFADRAKAAPVNFLGVGVYDLQAWNDDPQVIERGDALAAGSATHVIVYVIAACVGNAVSSHRLVRNLAGGNNAYKLDGTDKNDAEVARRAVAAAHKAVNKERLVITVADRDA